MTRVDQHGATLQLNEQGLMSLFDEVYAATEEEQVRRKPFRNKAPLREEQQQFIDAKTGKTKETTVYIYPLIVPKAAFLVDLDASDKTLWVKLWRDMVWSILRGVPATRLPYEKRAKGKYSKDASGTWNNLTKPHDHKVDLPSTYFIGAQASTAENVPFFDRSRYQFLLHFWPYTTQVYVPAVMNNKEETSFVGYALTVPDVADLEWFCEELPAVLRNRGVQADRYRPKDSVVDLAIEGALDIFNRLRERIKVKEGEKATSGLVLAIDVMHADKQGNNIRLLGSSRIEPEAAMIDKWVVLRTSLRNPLFRRQCLVNLVNMRSWYEGFDGIFSRHDYKQSIGSKSFRSDARQSFVNSRRVDKGGHEAMNESIEAPEEDPNQSENTDCETLIYGVVGTYIRRKLKSKYELEWESAKADVKKSAEYQEKKEKIAKEAFLAVRSRTGMDFAEYFASTLCSVRQRISEKDFVILAQALYQAPDKVRTLTMLALSARS